MTLYLIGTGLNENSLTQEALQAIKKSKKVYLENYTVDFPYPKKILEKNISKKIEELNREKVESEFFLNEAKKENISLLIYGDSLSATTHTELILSCKKKNIPYKVIHNASILTAIAETGLQPYKFGKITSMPAWKDNWKPTSFCEIIKQNQSIEAHTLLLIDISLEIEEAKKQIREAFKKESIKSKKIILCSSLGTNKSKIYYKDLEKLPKKIDKPYCIIIPSKLHFIEEEFLNNI